ADLRACWPRAPPKITSCIDWPRTASGDCSPSAHRTASVMFDFPEPLGPTMTLTPGPNSRRVRSGKDLKPFSVSDFRCMWSRVHRLQRVQGRPGGGLLGVLLAASAAAPDLVPAHRGRDLERAVVRGAR